MSIHEEMLSITYTQATGLGIVVGTIVRTITLVVNYRRTPIYPDGQLIHLFTGSIAAALGAVAIPALSEKDYVAFTFLALAIQHFWGIRKMGQESLNNLELPGCVRRRDAYIDRTLETCEARDYISTISPMIVSSVVLLMKSLPHALAVITVAALGMLSILLLKWFMRGERMRDICVIQQGRVQIQGSSLSADNTYATGTADSPVARGLFLQQGLGVVIAPKREQFRATLKSAGQRQAILYETASILGVETYQYVKRSVGQDRTVIALVPIDRDIGRMTATIQNIFVLENNREVRRITSR